MTASLCRARLRAPAARHWRRQGQLRNAQADLGEHAVGQRQAGDRRNLSRLRSAIHGRYLAEFAYRFKRRYQLADLVPRLAYIAARTPPLPHRLLILAGTAV